MKNQFQHADCPALAQSALAALARPRVFERRDYSNWCPRCKSTRDNMGIASPLLRRGVIPRDAAKPTNQGEDDGSALRRTYNDQIRNYGNHDRRFVGISFDSLGAVRADRGSSRRVATTRGGKREGSWPRKHSLQVARTAPNYQPRHRKSQSRRELSRLTAAVALAKAACGKASRRDGGRNPGTNSVHAFGRGVSRARGNQWGKREARSGSLPHDSAVFPGPSRGVLAVIGIFRPRDNSLRRVFGWPNSHEQFQSRYRGRKTSRECEEYNRQYPFHFQTFGVA